MTIILNGNEHETAEASSISDLLTQLGLNAKPVVVEHNKTAIFPRDYAQTILRQNDRVEIINIAAGG